MPTAAKCTAHHGTHHPDLPLIQGLCLAVGGLDDGYRAASRYAQRVGGADLGATRPRAWRSPQVVAWLSVMPPSWA